MRRTAAVLPFKRAAADSVRPEPWLLVGSGEVLGDRVEHWDPDLTLRLDRAVVVDIDLVLDSTGIPTTEPLVVAAVWRSDRTRLRGLGMSVPLPRNHGETLVALSLDVPGHLAGGSLEIRTVLARAEEGTEGSPIVARRAGSVLWEGRDSVALEGSAARFPVTVLDFSGVPGLADGAAWALEWSPRDLDQPVLGAMRLLVNSGIPVVVEAIRGDGSGDGQIASMVRFDVAKSLVLGALSADDFRSEEREFEPDSVGRMLQDLLERYWPGVATAVLARRLTETPHRIESELQAKADLFPL